MHRNIIIITSIIEQKLKAQINCKNIPKLRDASPT